ncbi:EutN/CcmL family microcompartment protein [Sulfuriroseicoccus oceanibius]|uniref:EutN/CcmL family microcompartment protein n=1 Tax=Sulfuriroseicoccus oceanibius TaxID=2707525 RepID=A0A6B3LA40_9BACT|nr:EutN/CcmL family microcompartment protein [Sulfuriroseicoccus oceanibius]QQL44564.1 EutN/CcmL family microcompartment protein [Sulfuriroseicoccus oceanibius]
MLHAQVVGNAVASTKHPSLGGFKMLLVQPLDADGAAAGTPIVALDTLGAGLHQRVVVSSDGIAARGLVHDEKSPARMFIQAIIDEVEA